MARQDTPSAQRVPCQIGFEFQKLQKSFGFETLAAGFTGNISLII